MSALIDIAGKKFGKWTAMEHLEGKYWLCECECGIRKSVSGCDLRAGRTRSCGCGRSESYAKSIKSLKKGQVFGRWTTMHISETKRGRHGDIYWECECACGNRKPVCARSLVSGDSKSCGCLKSESPSKRVIDLKGQQFGKWTVLEEGGRTPTKQVRWICLCDCGTIMEVNSNDLIQGKSTNCGCSRKYRFGAKGSNWQGGLTKIGKSIRNHLKRTTHWVQGVFEINNYTCQKCGQRGGSLHAHHIVQLSDIIKNFNIETIEDIGGCEILFDINNGVCLCESCHNWVHSKKNDNGDFLENLQPLWEKDNLMKGSRC